MGRNKKKPEYDSEKIMKEFIDSVVDCYITTGADQGDNSIRNIAEEFDITPLKVRKILITAGAFSTDISDEVNDLYSRGKSVLEIQRVTGLGRASVYSYLPYKKVIYNTSEVSLNAERLKKYRERKCATAKLMEVLYNDDIQIVANVLWDALVAFQAYPFKTVKGFRVTYEIKGNEIFFDCKSKSVTKSTVNIALEKVLKLKADNIEITGPKKIACFGASYLYPVFRRIGLIEIT